MHASCATSPAPSRSPRTLYASRQTRWRYFSTSGSKAATSPARHFSMRAESSGSTQSPADLDHPLDAAAAALIHLSAGPDIAQRQQGVETEAVALGTEPCDLAAGHRGDHGVSAEFLASVDVGKVDFDHRERDRGHRIAQRDRVVREGAGMSHDAADTRDHRERTTP